MDIFGDIFGNSGFSFNFGQNFQSNNNQQRKNKPIAKHINVKLEDLYNTGTLGKILQLLRLPDGTVKVLIEGGVRISIQDFNIIDNYIQSNYKILKEDENIDPIEEKALLRTATELLE